MEEEKKRWRRERSRRDRGEEEREEEDERGEKGERQRGRREREREGGEKKGVKNVESILLVQHSVRGNFEIYFFYIKIDVAYQFCLTISKINATLKIMGQL